MKINVDSVSCTKKDNNWMLTMLIANPKQFTIVSPVPFKVIGAALATKLENWGESAVTAIPQIHHPIKKRMGGNWKSIGDTRQKPPEISKANSATL